MRSRNPEAQWLHHEEEVLEFVQNMGIPKAEFMKTKDSLYHLLLFKTLEEIDELDWQNPKKYKLIKENERSEDSSGTEWSLRSQYSTR
jgi:hypothetical protein